MERYGPAANRQCGELCPYVARVRVFAWQNGLAWDAALEELERRAARMCPGGTLPGCAQPAVCEQQGALPEECRVWRLLLSASGACGMSIYEYMKSAQAAALFDMPQASEAPRPEEAAPQGGRTGEKSTPAERNGAGNGVPVQWRKKAARHSRKKRLSALPGSFPARIWAGCMLRRKKCAQGGRAPAQSCIFRIWKGAQGSLRSHLALLWR